MAETPTHRLAEDLAVHCDEIALRAALLPTALRQLRERRGLTLALAAGQIGCHQGVLSAWETGVRPIPVTALPDLARWARNRYQSRRPVLPKESPGG